MKHLIKNLHRGTPYDDGYTFSSTVKRKIFAITLFRSHGKLLFRPVSNLPSYSIDSYNMRRFIHPCLEFFHCQLGEMGGIKYIQCIYISYKLKGESWMKLLYILCHYTAVFWWGGPHVNLLCFNPDFCVVVLCPLLVDCNIFWHYLYHLHSNIAIINRCIPAGLW